jgi:hypothetical protein
MEDNKGVKRDGFIVFFCGVFRRCQHLGYVGWVTNNEMERILE